jgi:hypothetical protein
MKNLIILIFCLFSFTLFSQSNQVKILEVKTRVIIITTNKEVVDKISSIYKYEAIYFDKFTGKYKMWYPIEFENRIFSQLIGVYNIYISKPDRTLIFYL